MNNTEIAIYYLQLAAECAKYEEYENMDMLIETSKVWQEKVVPGEEQLEMDL